MEQLLEAQMMQRRFETWLIGVFSVFALLLAALGVFAVMHYSVAAKRREIGVRMAVGARSADILRFVLSDGTRLAAVGVAVGFVLASWLTNLIRSMLFNVKPGDPVTLVGGAVVLIAVALAASYMPALRASRIDPMETLRNK